MQALSEVMLFKKGHLNNIWLNFLAAVISNRQRKNPGKKDFASNLKMEENFAGVKTT